MKEQVAGLLVIFHMVVNSHEKAINTTSSKFSKFTSDLHEIKAISCNFNQGLRYCPAYHHGEGKLAGEFQWSISRVDEDGNGMKTPSHDTGPSTETAKTHGKYAYIESSKRLNGDRARLVAGWFRRPTSPRACLKFSYHMYGQTLGSLRVILVTKDKNQTIWYLKGDATMKDRWMTGSTPILSRQEFMIVFEGVTSYSYHGDIAIDDIMVTSRYCWPWPSIAKQLPSDYMPMPSTVPKNTNCGTRTVKNVDSATLTNQIVQANSNKPSAGNILGGKDTTSLKWPWMAMIKEQNRENVWNHICGGTLIGTSWVATAAHCLVQILDKKKIKVRLGTDKTNDVTKDMQEFEIENAYIHPKYQTSTWFNYDIALIKLKSPVKVTQYVNPICLDMANAGFNNCWIAGWGKNGSDDNSVRQETLKETDVRILGQQMCSNAYKGQVTDKMICAGNSQKDACQYDSGGPLACESKLAKNKWYLSGVTSWGGQAGCGKTLGVYTNVAAVRDWIVSVQYCTSSHRLREFYPDMNSFKKSLQNQDFQGRCS